MNDLWMYDALTNQWAWISGSNIPFQYGIYPTPPDIPSPREPVPSDPVSTPYDSTIEIVVPSVIVPVTVVGIVVGLVFGLRKRFKQNKMKNMDNPIVLKSVVDKRLIPYDSVTLDKEIGAGSYGKGTPVITRFLLY